MEKTKFDFSIVNSLGVWTDQNAQDLLEQEILKSETIAAIGVYPGVKYKAQLKYLQTESQLQPAVCGTPTTSGSTTLSAKDVSVKPYMEFETLCPADLDTTSLQLSLQPGWNESLPFEAQYVASKVKQIKANLEKKIWWNASGATEFSGLVEQFDADADVIDVVADFSATGLTAAQLIALYDKVVEGIPQEVTEMTDLTLFLGHESFRRLSKAFLSANNIQLAKMEFNGVDTFEYPSFTNLKLKPVNGLNDAVNANKRVFISPAANLLYICDMVSEEEKTTMIYNPYARRVEFTADFKAGAGYYFGSYIVASQKA